MGEIADDHVDRMLDDLFEGRGNFYPRYNYEDNSPRKTKAHKSKGKTFDEAIRAAEYPSKKTDPSLLRDYPEKTFDMGFFPTVKREPVVENPWAPSPDEEAPF